MSKSGKKRHFFAFLTAILNILCIFVVSIKKLTH